MGVDQPHRFLRVETGHDDAGPTRMHVRHEIAQRRDVEQGQCQEVPVRRREAEGRDDDERRGEDVRVREHGAPRDHVDRRRGDHREGIVARHVRGRRRHAFAVQAGQGPEARRRRISELVPVRDGVPRAGPLPHHGQGRGVRHHHRGRRPLDDSLDFLSHEPPVDGIRDDALARARPVEVDVGHVVLGENADAIAFGEAQARQPGRQRVGSLEKLAEGPLPRSLDQRGRVARERRAARQHVVDREGLGAHPPTGPRCRPSWGRGRRAARSSPGRPPCSCPSP